MGRGIYLWKLPTLIQFICYIEKGEGEFSFVYEKGWYKKEVGFSTEFHSRITVYQCWLFENDNFTVIKIFFKT